MAVGPCKGAEKATHSHRWKKDVLTKKMKGRRVEQRM